MKSRDAYFQTTKNNPPKKFLVDFMTKYEIGKNWIEIGSWAGNDTLYLLEKWFTVHAIDGDVTSEKYIIEKIGNQYNNHFSFSQQMLWDLKLPPTDVVYSAYTLPFCKVDLFDSMMENIVNSIQIWWYFIGNFFWENDDWKHLALHTEKEIIQYFQKFEIIEISNQEYDKLPAINNSTPKHWHEITVIAKKIL